MEGTPTIADAQAAHARAQTWLSEHIATPCVITDAKELHWGWVVSFNSAAFVQAGDPSAALVGHGPLFVNRDGSVHPNGSAIPLSLSLYHYELSLGMTTGDHELVVDMPARYELLMKLREALELSLEDTAALRAKLPGAVCEGPRSLMEWYRTNLQRVGVTANVQARSK